MLESRIVVYAGNAPWLMLSNHLLTEEATCTMFALKNGACQMQHIEGDWFLGGSGLVFEPAPTTTTSEDKAEEKGEEGARKSAKEQHNKGGTSMSTSKTWESFVAMSLRKSHDIAAQFELGQLKKSLLTTSTTSTSTTSTITGQDNEDGEDGEDDKGNNSNGEDGSDEDDRSGSENGEADNNDSKGGGSNGENGDGDDRQ